MARTPRESDSDAQQQTQSGSDPGSSNPTPRQQLAQTSSTNPQGVVDRTRVGVVTPGLDFEDGQADHRSDLQEPIGNGAQTDPETGVLKGTKMTPMDRSLLPPDAGPHWVQEVDDPRGLPGRTAENIDQ